MKPFICCLFAVGLLALPISAQSQRGNKHEVKIGIGIGEDSRFNDVFDDYLDRYYLDADDDWGSSSVTASFFGEYLYHVGKKVAVGGSFGYSETSHGGVLPWEYRRTESLDNEGDMVNYHGIDLPNSDKRVFKIKGQSFYVVPMVKYEWLQYNHFMLYSKGGVGVKYYKLKVSSEYLPEKKEDKAKVAYQVSLVGIEVGGEHVRFFTEFGYGDQGVFNLGVVAHF